MRKIFLAVLAALCFPALAVAGPADYIYSPAVEFGEHEVELKYGYAEPKNGITDLVSIGLGYGAKERWFTEISLKRARKNGDSLTLAEWENKFQLTETGEYAVDVGFITEVEVPISGDAPWELKVGPLLQTEFGQLQLNGNLLFTREFGSTDKSGVPYNTHFSYQWQAKYRWQKAFEFGLQGLGAMGKWNQWDKPAEQDHRIGPAVFGKVAIGNQQAIRYNAAWLLGASQAAPSHVIRMQVEYEF